MKIEASALKAFENRTQEVSNLKNNLKKQDSENAALKNDLNLAHKAVKEKEKEIYRSDKKNCKTHYMGRRVTTSDKFITSLFNVLF